MTTNWKVQSCNIVKQVTGVPTPFTPSPPPSRPAEVDSTAKWDILSADIGIPWDMKQPTPRLALVLGDILGSGLYPYDGYNAQKLSGANGRAKIRDAGQGTLAATSFTGTQTMPFTRKAGFPKAGYFSIDNGFGPGIPGEVGVGSIFSYSSFTGSADSTVFHGVRLIAGGGFVSPDMEVWAGDQRLGRDNTLEAGGVLFSTDTDLSHGTPIVDAVDGAGFPNDNVAISPFAGEVRHFDYDVGAIWPSKNGLSTYWNYTPVPGSRTYETPNPLPQESLGRPASVRKTDDFFIKITFPTPHGIEPRPLGSSLKILPIGYQSGRGTAVSSFSTAALPSTIPYNFIVSWPVTGFTGNRFTVRLNEVTNGEYRWATIQFTGDTGTAFTGCTLVNGSGTVSPDNPILQGVWNSPNFNAPKDVVQFTFWNEFDANIDSVADAYTLNILTYHKTRFDGDVGDSCLILLPGCMDYLDPNNAWSMGHEPVGAIAIPDTNTGFVGENGKVQIIFARNAWGGGDGRPFYWGSCSAWYSLDTGLTWTKHPTCMWNSGKRNDNPVVSVTPYLHTDGYVYSIANPGNILMRCPVLDVLDKSAWRYWTGSTWTATMPTTYSACPAQFPSSTGQVYSLFYSTFYNCWICLVTGFLVIQVYLADNVTGPWVGPQTVLRTWDFTPNQTYIYGQWMHPWSEQYGNGVDGGIHFFFTMLNSYQVYQAKLTLTDPLGAEADVEKIFNVQQIEQGGSIANWDSWLKDNNQWVWASANSFTITTPSTAKDPATYLTKYAKIMVEDTATGTPLSGTKRYANILSSTSVISSGTRTTTVTLIPHNDGFGSGAILNNSVLANNYYSHADLPPNWPGTFAYTPTLLGWSSAPASSVYTYTIHGDRMTISITQGASGNNDANVFNSFTGVRYKSISLPSGCAIRNRTNYQEFRTCQAIDSTFASGATQIGGLFAFTNLTVIQAYLNYASTQTFGNNTGSSRIIGSIDFELAA